MKKIIPITLMFSFCTIEHLFASDNNSIDENDKRIVSNNITNSNKLIKLNENFSEKKISCVYMDNIKKEILIRKSLEDDKNFKIFLQELKDLKNTPEVPVEFSFLLSLDKLGEHYQNTNVERAILLYEALEEGVKIFANDYRLELASIYKEKNDSRNEVIWLRKAAEKNSPKERLRLEIYYKIEHEKRQVKENPSKKNIMKLAKLYHKIGNEEKEMEWLLKGAEINSVRASDCLGDRYFEKERYPEAFDFFNKAALLNYKKSWPKLAHMYEKGLGTLKNPAAANYWNEQYRTL